MRNIPNLFRTNEYIKNIIIVITTESPKAHQNQYFSKKNGKVRNIGSVGRTYQKV
jgi:DNA polymerase/3'-5' exonuclease PolX